MAPNEVPSGDSPDALVFAEMQRLLKDVGMKVASACPPGIGFALLVFQFGPGGFMTYASNGQREDMVKAMRELIARVEAE